MCVLELVSLVFLSKRRGDSSALWGKRNNRLKNRAGTRTVLAEQIWRDRMDAGGTWGVSCMVCVWAVLILASWEGDMLEFTVMFSSVYPHAVVVKNGICGGRLV